jgi:NAD-dependent dihydropyrimidine dehydrogenase PreA subunit
LEVVKMSKANLWPPREEIDWYPRINPDLCIKCGSCAEFCMHGVYSRQGGKIVVSQPYECIVGCEACKYRCPAGAISFPSREELKQMLRTLREKYSNSQK